MSEFIHHFGIDWRLFAAQVVNFVVLFVLLKTFAYGPVITAMRKRAQRIEEGIDMRCKAEEQLKNSERMREETLDDARRKALGIVNMAEKTAREHQDQIMEGANKKVEGIIADARRVIDAEKESMSRDVRHDAQELIRQGIARVIASMPPSKRDEQLIKEALKELDAAGLS